MSLGWQTESAILPSKAKPIAVDQKSLLPLKALILQQEQQRKNEKGTAKKIQRVPFHKKQQEETKGSSSRSKDGIDEGVIKRAQKALEAKAKLYEELSSKGGGGEGEASLVDFNRKKTHKKEDEDEDEEGEDEEEEGGGFQQAVSSAPLVSFSYGPQQWQWSRGSGGGRTNVGDDSGGNEGVGGEEDAVVDKWREERRRERDLQSTIEDRISAEMRQEEEEKGGEGIASSSAKIRSQWEKTLNSKAREFLQGIHEKVEEERQKGGAGGAGDGEDPQSRGKRSLREEKLEMIKRKRLENNPPPPL